MTKCIQTGQTDDRTPPEHWTTSGLTCGQRGSGRLVRRRLAPASCHGQGKAADIEAQSNDWASSIT